MKIKSSPQLFVQELNNHSINKFQYLEKMHSATQHRQHMYAMSDDILTLGSALHN